MTVTSGPLAGGFATGHVVINSMAIVKITEVTVRNGDRLSIPPCKYYGTFSGDQEADRVQVDQSEWYSILHGGTLHGGATLHIRFIGPVTIPDRG